MNATMTKKLLVGSCVLLFCLLVLLPSPVEASKRRDQQSDNLLAKYPKHGRETTVTFQPHEPKPLYPQPKIETPQASDTDDTQGDDFWVQSIGATIICIFLSLGWLLCGWLKQTFFSAPPAIPITEEQDGPGDQQEEIEEQEQETEEEQEEEPEDQDDDVNEDHSVNPLRSPPPSPSAAYLFSPARSKSSSSSSPSRSSSSSSSSLASPDLQQVQLLEDLQERDLGPALQEFRKMFNTLYHLMISGHKEMTEKVDSIHLDLQEVKGTVNRSETVIEKSKAMQTDSRDNQRKAEHDRKVKAFDRIRFFALSWWMASILITGAFLLWGNESSTFNFDYWTIILFVVATVPSFFLGFNISSGLLFFVFFLVWANSSAVLFVALRTTLTSSIQLAIFSGLSSAIVGNYLQQKFDVVKNERYYKVLLTLGFICLGIALGWISMFIPAFGWENAIVEWCDSHIPTLPRILQSVGSVATYLFVSVVSMPKTFLSFFWSSPQTSPFVTQ